MLLFITGCESVKSIVGLDHDAPNEFAVVPLAPLSLPNDYNKTPINFVVEDNKSEPEVSDKKPKKEPPSKQTGVPEALEANDILMGSEPGEKNSKEANKTKLMFEESKPAGPVTQNKQAEPVNLPTKTIIQPAVPIAQNKPADPIIKNQPVKTIIQPAVPIAQNKPAKPVIQKPVIVIEENAKEPAVKQKNIEENLDYPEIDSEALAEIIEQDPSIANNNWKKINDMPAQPLNTLNVDIVKVKKEQKPIIEIADDEEHVTSKEKTELKPYTKLPEQNNEVAVEKKITNTAALPTLAEQKLPTLAEPKFATEQKIKGKGRAVKTIEQKLPELAEQNLPTLTEQKSAKFAAEQKIKGKGRAVKTIEQKLPELAEQNLPTLAEQLPELIFQQKDKEKGRVINTATLPTLAEPKLPPLAEQKSRAVNPPVLPNITEQKNNENGRIINSAEQEASVLAQQLDNYKKIIKTKTLKTKQKHHKKIKHNKRKLRKKKHR